MSRRILHGLMVLIVLVSFCLPAPAAAQSVLEATLDPSVRLAALPPAGPFILTFTQPMNPVSSAMPLLVYPYVPGRFEWNDARTRLAFTPDGLLAPGENYTFYLDPALTSASGDIFPAVTFWEAHIRTAPAVTTRNLRDQDLRRPLFYLAFDHSMDESASPPVSAQPALALDLYWENHYLYVQPVQPLTPGQSVQFTLSEGLADENGTPLGEPYIWNYTPPGAALAVKVVSDKKLEIKFSYPLPAGLKEPPVTIQPALSGAWTRANNTTFQFAASAPLDPAIEYTAAVRGALKDGAGHDLPAFAPVKFSLPAPISSVKPANNSRYINRIESIDIYFTRSIDPASLEKAFHLNPPLAGKFKWNKAARFFPDSPPTGPAQTYTATLDTSLTDTNGRRVMAKPYTWSFQAEFMDPTDTTWTVTFGQYGPNVQVLDAGGRRALQFAYNNSLKKSGETLTLDLYALDLATFVQRYRADYQMRQYANKDINVAGLERVKTWYLRQDAPEIVIPPDVPAGLYVIKVNGETPNQGDALFIALTHATLTVKRSGQQLFVWLNQVGGSGLAGQEVRLYNQRGEKVRQAQTGENGLVRLSIPPGDEPLLLAARGEEGDVTLSGFDWPWREDGGWYSYMFGGAPLAINTLFYLYTDRPIYQPGQVVNFKAILRKDEDVRYSLLPENTPVTLRLRDGRDNLLQTQTLTLNNFGTLNGQFTLAESGMLGVYSLEAELGGEMGRQTFTVEEYRKPDIELKAHPDKEIYTDGETVTIDIDARYYFGQPLANQTLSVDTFNLSRVYNGWWEGGSPGSLDNSYYWYEMLHTFQVQTDETGHAQLILNAGMGSSDYLRTKSWRDSLEEIAYGVQVNASDGSGPTTSTQAIYRVWNADRRLSVKPEGGIKNPNQPFGVTAQMVDMQGKGLANLPVTIELRRWNARNYDYDHVIGQVEAKTAANGKAALQLTAPQSGHYRVDAIYESESGATLKHSCWVYVAGENDTWAREGSALKITAGKSGYQPYETASFVIESSFAGPGLITFERGRVNRAVPVTLTPPLTQVDIQISEEDAPNVFVEINAWEMQDTRPAEKQDEWSLSKSDAALRSASLELQVTPLQQPLSVELKTDRPTYAPRDTARVSLTTKDSRGRPVSAEISLALVDEAIFALAQDPTRPIYEAFYGRREHNVTTFDSMEPYRWLFQPGRGGGGGDGGSTPPRSNFPDTAVWLPSIRTNARGQAETSFTLPDSLTKWRLVARAVTRDTLVGETTASLLVQQEVSVRPVLPPSLTGGDQADLVTMVHNYSARSRRLEVSFSASRLSLAADSMQKVDLEPGEVAALKWPVEASRAGNAEVTVRVTEGGKELDAVQLPLEVRPYSVKDTRSSSGHFTDRAEIPVMLPPDALPESFVEVRLSRSIADNVLAGLEYLTGYPYGCTEQTMSRALPNAVVGRVLKQLGVIQPELEQSLPKLVNDGLSRLYGMQHDDHGWGWWAEDESDPYQTAWILYGLSMTRDAGFAVEEKVIDSGAGYLINQLHGEQNSLDPRTRAYILYALAISGNGVRDLTLEAAQNAASLDAFSQASLVIALEKLDRRTEAVALMRQILNQAIQKDGLVYWETGIHDGEYHSKTMASTTRTTAQVLAALLQNDPRSSLVPSVAAYLMSQRRAEGWGTTNETAHAVMALSDYLLQVKESAQDSRYTLRINGQETSAATLSSGSLSQTIQLPAAQFKPGLNTLALEQSGAEGLYYTVNATNLLSRQPVLAAGPVTVTREFLSGAQYQDSERFAIGEWVTVRLKITVSQPVSYVMIEDSLPAGLEAVNENLTNATVRANASNVFDYWETWSYEDRGYNQKEIHGSRVTFFKTELPAGLYKVEYRARATHAGQFTAMPVQVSAMYDSRVWGRSASDSITVTVDPVPAIPDPREKRDAKPESGS